MKIILYFVSYIFLFSNIYCPPVSNTKKGPDDDFDIDKILEIVHYKDYLSQVMKELQNDEGFAKSTNDSDDTDVIGNALKYASSNVRSKLDELKRIEIMRLTKLQKELDKRKLHDDNSGLEIPKPPTNKLMNTNHIDDINPDQFSTDDLKKLLHETSEIFRKIDDKSEEVYKVHEMEKEVNKRAELEIIKDAKEREEKLTKWHDAEKARHSKHEVMFEPGSIEHMKSVWKNKFKMDEEYFSPRNLFAQLDIDNSGYLHDGEIEMFMQSEVDKAYDPNDHNTDWVERHHESNRMRNTFLMKVDTDWNRLVSLDEFLAWTKSQNYQENHPWKTQEELEPAFTDDEFEKFYKDYVTKHPDLVLPPLQMPPKHPSSTTTTSLNN